MHTHALVQYTRNFIFHEGPHGRLVHHFMTKFEGGTVTRVLRQTSRAARHSQHDEEMRGRAATRAEKSLNKV